jgi:hypothetical protein
MGKEFSAHRSMPRNIKPCIKPEGARHMPGYLTKEEIHSPRVLAIQDWVLQTRHKGKQSGYGVPRAQRDKPLALQIFPHSPWNGKTVCLAKDQATREARTRTTKRYVTLDSMFFSYSLELEEAFHQ